jgi:hypothetical protein
MKKNISSFKKYFITYTFSFLGFYIEDNSFIEPRKSIKDIRCAIKGPDGDYLKKDLSVSSKNLDSSLENIKQSCFIGINRPVEGYRNPNENNEILKFMSNKNKNLKSSEYFEMDFETESNFIFHDDSSINTVDLQIKEEFTRTKPFTDNIDSLRSIILQEPKLSGASNQNGGRFPRQKFTKKAGNQPEAPESEEDNQFYRYRTPPRSNSLNPGRHPQGSTLQNFHGGHQSEIKTLTDRYMEVNQNKRELEQICNVHSSLQV